MGLNFDEALADTSIAGKCVREPAYWFWEKKLITDIAFEAEGPGSDSRMEWLGLADEVSQFETPVQVWTYTVMQPTPWTARIWSYTYGLIGEVPKFQVTMGYIFLYITYISYCLQWNSIIVLS